VRDGCERRPGGDTRQRRHVPARRTQRRRGDETRERERKRSGDGLWWYNAPGDPDIMNRAADLALAGTALVVTSPLLGLAALAVKLGGGGPILYRQTRVGLDGADFELLKLRTMIVGAEHQGAGLAVDKGDARITRAGAVLRRLSLDELPQLWNVIRGDMSMIGPRPTLRYQVERYTPRQRRRLEVKPGITGWAQIHGRATLPWEERIELDVWYVEHRSPLLDLRILLRTPLALFGGTYKGATGGWHG
jgi:lipopolysaccharide/colanic/teichoic acid biosynthesis glycosyltransferase